VRCWEQSVSRRPKAERRQGRRGRRVGTREVRQRFLIVCEGEQTEPKYFQSFQVPGLVIKTEDANERGRALVDRATQLREEDDYDQVWCVFDRDDLLPSQIGEAFQRARQVRISIAFSNQAFELWYLLHFDYHNVAITRRDYYERLERRLGRAYAKNSTTMYDLLIDTQPIAIANARRLLALYDPWRPAEHDPCTTVHHLVEELNKHRRS
jgi:RloB-like protein